MGFVCVKTLYFVSLDSTLPGNELTAGIAIPLSTLSYLGSHHTTQDTDEFFHKS